MNMYGKAEIVCKLTDFGFATTLEHDEKITQRLGTPAYMAPEIIMGKYYDAKVDTWALGVLTYILLSGGTSPWKGRTIKNLQFAIKTKEPDMSVLDRYAESSVLKDFVSCCLDKNPRTRYSAE